MFRIPATVVASSAVLMGLALPAGASSAQVTSIESFASSVTTVAYQQPVTFTGELVAAAAQTPVPNEPVQIEFEPAGQGGFAPVATGTTGSDGQFTITTTLPSGGYARAVFAGDTGLMPTSSAGWGILLQATHVPGRLVLDPVPSTVPAGTPVTFSGTMQVQVNGTWQPFAGIPLTLTMEPYTSTQTNIRYATTSGPDGRFSLTETVSETSAWSVDTSLNGGYWETWFPDYASASYNWIDGVSKTLVTGFSLPARDEAHLAYYNGMYASGQVERWNGSSWVGLAYGWVQLYYRPKGSTAWHKDNGGETDAYGRFSVIAGVHLGTADWQVRVAPSADTLTSTSTNTVTSTVTDRTHFASASIQRRSSGSSIIGQVTDWYSGQVSFSSLRGLTLRLYYRPTNSATWHYYKTTTVGSNGWVYFSEAKGHGYYFKVVFPAQGPFQSCTSRTL
jgi:hypothetical protein